MTNAELNFRYVANQVIAELFNPKVAALRYAIERAQAMLEKQKPFFRGVRWLFEDEDNPPKPLPKEKTAMQPVQKYSNQAGARERHSVSQTAGVNHTPGVSGPRLGAAAMNAGQNYVSLNGGKPPMTPAQVEAARRKGLGQPPVELERSLLAEAGKVNMGTGEWTQFIKRAAGQLAGYRSLSPTLQSLVAGVEPTGPGGPVGDHYDRVGGVQRGPIHRHR
jgi:hypothetical protein